MKFFNSIIKLSLVSTFIVTTAVNAGSTTWEWNLDAGAGTNGSSTLSSTGTNNDNSNTVNADLSAYADTANPNDDILRSGKFYYYGTSGWGVTNRDENESDYPGHGIDNQYDFDMVLVSFDTSITLTQINFGWVYDDADFTVLAYSGNAAPTLNNSTWSNVSSDSNPNSDWITVGNYEANSAGYYSINQGNISEGKVSSQYWLIGAYNSIFGATANDNGLLGTGATDAFKIKSIKGTTNITTPPEEVPAPAAFGLLLVGALGIYARRNKQTA